MALEMRTVCERCDAPLAADGDARICTEAMNGVCPNCGGELIPRPRRAAS